MRIHRVGLTAVLCVLGLAVGLAADPHAGTWKLNEASSKLKGTARNHTVVYAEAGENMTITIDGVDESGSVSDAGGQASGNSAARRNSTGTTNM